MLGIINLDHEQDFLNELTYFRCGASVPFAGKYRLIDFVLSNMVYSQITDVAIFARRKYRSLMDHLGEGKAWNLDRKRGGLFILPPDWNDPTDISQGDLQHFHNNLDFLHRGTGKYILISGSQHLCHIDFQQVCAYHRQTGADVTVVYKEVEDVEEEHKSLFRLGVNRDGRVLGFSNDCANRNVCMNMYILEKKLLLDLVAKSIAYGANNFFRDGIINNLSKLNVYGYAYEGFLAVINSIESYYKHSLNLLNPEMYHALFPQERLIYTKTKDEAPAKYLENACVSNSMVANGCVIEGTVENSILFRGVHVHKGTHIKNSIIMQRCTVEENTVLEHVILDKEVYLSGDRTLIGASEKPYVVAKRKVM